VSAEMKAALDAAKGKRTTTPPEADWASMPAPDRSDFLVAAWRRLELPQRDYLLGDIMCTTSRWLLIGQTGVGKTLFALDLAAVAAGAMFLGWQGRRPSRVMFLDGELPAETFKERLELIAATYGDDIQLYAYNRDRLGPDEMPPFNTDNGQAWLWREIDAVKPDLIILDSIMCLLVGAMSEEESWAPVKELMQRISSRRIAQMWLHHTGHDASRGFGTKTREWQMDTVAMLSEIDDGAELATTRFQLEFTKARLRTPANFAQFITKIVTRGDHGFSFTEGRAEKGGRTSQVDIMRLAYINAYERLADSIEPSLGFDGKAVKKVTTDAIRAELHNRGFLDEDDRGNISQSSRDELRKAKKSLLAKGGFVESNKLFWRTI
jgi:AAA domain